MAENPTAKSSTQANLSDLVKEMVKEMDANEFYSRTDLYDESAEVIDANMLLLYGLPVGRQATAAVSRKLCYPSSIHVAELTRSEC